MDPTLTLLILLGGAGLYWLGRRQGAARSGPAVSPKQQAILDLAQRVPIGTVHPGEFLRNAAFLQGVRLLSAADETHADLLALAQPEGENPGLACMALEVLRGRPADEHVGRRLLENVGRVRVELLYFYLRALPAMLPDKPLIGPVLTAVANHWDSAAIRGFAGLQIVLREFAAERLASGERPAAVEPTGDLNETTASDLVALVDHIGQAELAPLAEPCKRWLETRIDRQFLATFGRVWTAESAEAALARVVRHDRLGPAAAQIVASVQGSPPRSVLLLGEAGAGKSVLARTALAELRGAGWTVLEASSAELLAGQMYVGQLEERLTRLLREIDARRRVVWYVPDFANLAWVGRHQYSRSAALDYLLPHIERGSIVIVGESQPGPFEEMTRLAPRCLSVMHTLRVEPLDEAATLGLARHRVAEEARVAGIADEALVAEPLLREAWQLADQYLRDRVAPGNLLLFLDAALQRRVGGVAPSDARSSLTLDDLILTLSGLTGLPSSILDEREVVDLDALRRFFETRVIGQPEATDCLVERVAMIKAGVTDPTRPAGVFLFAGPTGTGKTEIAKTLATFLFGSEQRLIRLDMSEMQTPESLSRIIGEPGWTAGGDRSLTEAVRKQPFSVVLLDEFEKSHPNVWDLFLQVFDDGRLTDRRGVVADFRHTIIILTSNLGALIPTGTSLGFGGADSSFRPEIVLREVGRSFRREFVNRLDRIVVFRPLGRETMRDILRREIHLALERRGLRNRNWAVEWEHAALEFLLDQGFTPDLGARPLKRAIERHFLAPLARTIVNHQYPRGDQFLFVRSDGRALDVVFVDPDGPAEEGAATEEMGAPEPEVGRLNAAPSLEELVLHPRCGPEAIARLSARLDDLTRTVEHEAWRERKGTLMARLGEPRFWDTPGRFAVLGDIEYLDRVEAGLEHSRSLLTRLSDPAHRRRTGYPRDLVGRVAQQLYLLTEACADVREGRPREAFLEIDAGYGSGGTAADRDAFALRIGEMYRRWAERRGMQCEVLEQSGGDGHEPYRLLLAVAGYGSYAILTPEEGLHVHEQPDGAGGHAFKKCAIHVRVAAQPADRPAADPGRVRGIALRAQAVQALAARDRTSLEIVRRYRELPSPIVRDDVRGWRTGRLDAVLGGNFDVIG